MASELDNIIDDIINKIDKCENDTIKKIKKKANEIIKKYAAENELIIRGKTALRKLLKQKSSKIELPQINPTSNYFQCYSRMGMKNIGNIIRLLKNAGYDNIRSESSTTQSYLSCSIFIGNRNLKIIEIIDVNHTHYNFLIKSSIKIGDLYCINNVLAYQYINNKLSIEANKEIYEYKMLFNNFIPELEIYNGPSDMKFARKMMEKNKRNVKKSAMNNIAKLIEKNIIKLFDELCKENDVIFVDDIAYALYAMNSGENSVFLPKINKISVLSREPEKILEIAKKIIGKSAEYKKYESIADIVKSRIEMRVGGKLLLSIYNTIDDCIQYSIIQNGGKKNSKIEIKIGNYFTVMSYYFSLWWLFNIFGKNSLFIALSVINLIIAREYYLEKNNLLGIENNIFRVFDAKCFQYDNKYIFASDLVHPKILMLEYKKKYGIDKFKEIKRTCKKIDNNFSAE